MQVAAFGINRFQDEINTPAGGLAGALQFPDVGLPDRLQSQVIGKVVADGKSRALHQPVPGYIVAFGEFPGGPFRDMNVIPRRRKDAPCRMQVFHLLERYHVRPGLLKVASDRGIVGGFPRPAAPVVLSRQVFYIPGRQHEVPIGGNTRERRQYQP